MVEAQTSADSQTKITGSVNIAQAMKDYVKDHQTTSFSEAASIAEKQVTNGAVVGGHVGIVQGYLVYNFIVIDTENDTGYSIMIDAGDGKILEKSEGKDLKAFGKFGTMMPFGQHGMHGFDGHGFGGHESWKMTSPQNTPESENSDQG